MTYENANPNFSIILPGGCNAKCAFCFWRHQPVDRDDFRKGLARALRVLPAQFRAVSITGGEPTLSPSLKWALTALASAKRFDRVVLTTNGAKLAACIPAIADACTHVNVSRHAATDPANRRVFGTTTVPGVEELRLAIADLQALGVPVTLTKVLEATEKEGRIRRYLRFAKKQGVNTVHFRKQNGDLTPHPVEAAFARLPKRESRCPACANVEQFIEGVQVTWKRGLIETGDVGKHEVILQPDGRMTWDWAGKRPWRAEPKPPVSIRIPKISSGCGAPAVYASGCGAPSYMYSRGCGFSGRDC